MSTPAGFEPGEHALFPRHQVAARVDVDRNEGAGDVAEGPEVLVQGAAHDFAHGRHRRVNVVH